MLHHIYVYIYLFIYLFIYLLYMCMCLCMQIHDLNFQVMHVLINIDRVCES